MCQVVQLLDLRPAYLCTLQITDLTYHTSGFEFDVLHEPCFYVVICCLLTWLLVGLLEGLVVGLLVG